MNKYDISQKIEFKTGTYELNSDANFNFQLNRVIMWDGGDADEVATVSQSIKTSADWVNAMEQLAEKSHADGRTANEIAYLRSPRFCPAHQKQMYSSQYLFHQSRYRRRIPQGNHG